MTSENQSKIIGTLLLLAAGYGLYVVLSEPKKKLDGFSDTLDRFKELTENNDHTGAALVLARKYGTKKDVETLEEIQEHQDDRGRITKEEQSTRDKISNRLYYALKKKA